jgi:hypothetical protein
MSDRDVRFLEGAIRRHLPSAEVIWTAREGRISDAELSRRYREADLRAEAEALAELIGRRVRANDAIAAVERAILGDVDGLTESELALLPELLEILRAERAALG